jgi:hypothetical protein
MPGLSMKRSVCDSERLVLDEPIAPGKELNISGANANRLSHVDHLGAHEDRGVYRSVLALTRGGLWVRYRVGGREDGRLHAGGSRGRRQGLGGGGAVFGIYGCGWSSSSEMSDLWVVVVVVVFESPPRCWV